MNNLTKVVPFPIRIKVAIPSTIKNDLVVDKDVMHMSMPQILEATTY